MAGNSVFDEPWWLDALAPGAWDAVEVEQDGRVVARLPFVRQRRRGLTILTQPELTQSLGPWLEASEGKYEHRLEVEKARMTALIDALPAYDLFQQSFSTAITNWLPFYWAGFTSSVRYTYRLEDLTDPEAIWSGFADRARGDVRKAEKQLEVRDDLPLDALLALNPATFARQGIPNPYSDATLRRLDAAAVAHGARTLLSAVDATGNVHAAIYVVFNERSAYYLVGGRSADSATGATTLLLWSAIQRARETSQAFDFEGSMIESIERFFRSFGAKQTPYLRIVKASRRAQLVLRGLVQ